MKPHDETWTVDQMRGVVRDATGERVAQAAGEAPFASHLLYTQCLDDATPAEREMGIHAGLELAKRADRTVVYTDLGISGGMRRGIDAANDADRPVEYRRLEGWR